jgi:YVTN family beta-propeller protein
MRTSGFSGAVSLMRRLIAATLGVCCLLGLSIAALGTPSSARADGGAPNVAYVVGGGGDSGDLTAIDIAQRQMTWRMHVGGDPRAVLLSVDSRFAYIAQAGAAAVAVVDTHAEKVVATIPVGRSPSALALDIGTTGDLFVANTGSASVTVIDPQTQRALATVPVGQQPTGLAVAGAGSGIANTSDAEVYVANSGSDTISVLSATRRATIATIPAPGGPQSVVIPAAGGIAYVGTRAGSVLALSLSDHRLLGTLLRLRGSAAGLMDYDVVTGQVYVPDQAGGMVDVLRPASAGSGGAPANLPGEPARALPFDGGPIAVAITFDGAFGFVAEHDAGRVVMFDVAAHHTLATVTIGGSPRAIITGAYPPILSQQAAGIVGVLLYGVIGVILLVVIVFYLRYAQRMQARASSASAGAKPTSGAGEAGEASGAGDSDGTKGERG